MRVIVLAFFILTGCNPYLPARVDRVTPITIESVDSERLASEEAIFLGLINDYRKQHGVGPLQVSPTLTKAAQWMSNDMATKNYFNHVDSLGRTLGPRISSFGYKFLSAGENIAIARDAVGAMTLWQHSPSHNANMLRPEYKVIGIGTADSLQGVLWTTDFGGTID
jgi:uncharacterized protein YkwD